MVFSQWQFNFEHYALCKPSAVGDWTAGLGCCLPVLIRPSPSSLYLSSGWGKILRHLHEWEQNDELMLISVDHTSLCSFSTADDLKKNPSLSALKTFEIIARPRCHWDFCDHKSHERRHFFNRISEDSSRNYPDKIRWDIWTASWTLSV